MRSVIKRLAIFLATALFVIGITIPVFAAEEWVVIQDKNGKCSVRSVTNGKTPATFAGPFKTKAEANKAKEEKCKKPGKTDKPAQPAPAKTKP